MSDHRARHRMRDECITPGQRRHHALDAFQTSGSSPPSGSDARSRDGAARQAASVEPLVTTRQLAELWCQTPRWVLRMAKQQGLPHYRLGGAIRYRPSEAEAWLQQHRASADQVTGDDNRNQPVVLRAVSEGRGAA